MFSPELAAQFAEFLRLSFGSIPSNHNPPPPPPKTHHPESLGDIVIRAKLDGENYPLWVDLMDRAIGGKGLTSHIDGVSEPPLRSDPTYQQWQQRDHCVFNWIINNIEGDLVNEVSQYATAKDLWDGLAITYGSGTDPFQVYDLHRQTEVIKQEGLSLEALWNRLQKLWISIDRHDPNPMEGEAVTAIERYKKIVQKQRLYQFITALDDRYEAVKKDIIRRDPLPSARVAYGIVRREATNEQIMGGSLAKEAQHQTIGTGLAAMNRSRPGTQNSTPNRPWNRRSDDDRSRLVCSHCGGKKHTKEGCFLLVGYPEWWDDMKKQRAARAANRTGRAAVTVEDRATDSVRTTGNFGGGTTHSKEAGGGGEKSGMEEIAFAQAAEWVCEGGNESFHFNPPNFANIQIAPHQKTLTAAAPKAIPLLQKIPHTMPHNADQPQNSSKSDFLPSSSMFCHTSPDNSSNLQFSPNIVCENKFQALANTSTLEKLKKDSQWIFDCGATYTMSFEASDFLDVTTSERNSFKLQTDI